MVPEGDPVWLLLMTLKDIVLCELVQPLTQQSIAYPEFKTCEPCVLYLEDFPDERPT